MNTVLSFIIIALLVICLIMLIMIYSKKGTSSGELIKQQIELSSKATDDKISKLSIQMSALTFVKTRLSEPTLSVTFELNSFISPRLLYTFVSCFDTVSNEELSL